MSHNLFVLEASPESLGENVVESSAFSIHADLNILGLKSLQIAGAGKMASLIAVPNRGRGKRESPVHTVQNKGHLQGVIKLPGNYNGWQNPNKKNGGFKHNANGDSQTSHTGTKGSGCP